MILRVDADRIGQTAQPLRHAAEVARDLRSATAELTGDLSHVDSEPLRQAAGDFLHAWSGGLGGLADQGESLAAMLTLAGERYHQANEGVRTQARDAQP
jgi:hypothetical protein